MQWIMLAMVVVGLILLSARHPKLAFGILGVLIASGMSFLWLTSERGPDIQRLDIKNISIGKTVVAPAYAGSHRLTGRLFNRHEATDVRDATLSIDLLDCPRDRADDSECVLVGQTTERITVDLPAGQARDFALNMYLGEPVISGMIKWRFEVTEARR